MLLSSFRRYFKLASYLSTHTTESIVIAMGVPSLRVPPPPSPSFAGGGENLHAPDPSPSPSLLCLLL